MIGSIVCGAAAIVLLVILLVYRHRNRAQMQELVRLIERLNDGDYSIDWSAMKEGSYGILQNELYKTTVKLREAADQERADKQQVKDALADIAHQIKTPVTTIRLGIEELSEAEKGTAFIVTGHESTEAEDSLNSENMQERLLPENRRKQVLRRMKRSCDHISDLVSAVLKLSRLEANVVDFHPAVCSADLLCRAALEQVEALADLKGVEVVVSEKNDTVLSLDAVWQTEALSNILKNCIEHSPEGGRVEVLASENPLFVKIQICDQGGGVSESELPHLFERFYRVESTEPQSDPTARDKNPTVQEANPTAQDKNPIARYKNLNFWDSSPAGRDSSPAGLGLALAKHVITAEGGLLLARNVSGGMEFEIRYPIPQDPAPEV